MPSKSRNYKAKKRAVYRRNLATRNRLIAEGKTPAEAQAHIEEAGRLTDENHRARLAREQEEFERINDQLHATAGRVQPSVPQSVRAIPAGAFETSRRRH